MTITKMMQFDGPCPFLICQITKPHEHAICPECGAVRYGNMYCDTCKKEYKFERAIEQALAKGKKDGN